MQLGPRIAGEQDDRSGSGGPGGDGRDAHEQRGAFSPSLQRSLPDLAEDCACRRKRRRARDGDARVVQHQRTSRLGALRLRYASALVT